VRPNSSGPSDAPAYTPVWVIEVADAGAWGCTCTTARFTSPGKAQPNPNPSTTPVTRATGPGTASSASPTAPTASSPTTVVTSPWTPRRSASQPPDTRAVRQIRLPKVRVRPARPGGRPRVTAESTRKVPSPPAEAAPSATATPISSNALVARGPWPGRAGLADGGGGAGTSASAVAATPAAIANAQRQPNVNATVGTEAPANRVAAGMAACLIPNDRPCRCRGTCVRAAFEDRKSVVEGKGD